MKTIIKTSLIALLTCSFSFANTTKLPFVSRWTGPGANTFTIDPNDFTYDPVAGTASSNGSFIDPSGDPEVYVFFKFDPDDGHPTSGKVVIAENPPPWFVGDILVTGDMISASGTFGGWSGNDEWHAGFEVTGGTDAANYSQDFRATPIEYHNYPDGIEITINRLPAPAAVPLAISGLLAVSFIRRRIALK